MNKPVQNGLFDPEGIYRRVNSEAVLLFGGATALLMQVAHPKLAAAVSEHSTYRQRPLQRLYETVRAMQKIIFGDGDIARSTVKRINDIHQRVNGTLAEGTARYPAGTSYSATDPALIVWVQATLTATTLAVYRELVRPLKRHEEEDFYRDSRQLARLFGAPEAAIPADLEAFEMYMNEMIDGPELEITPTSLSVATDIVHPPIRGFPAVLDDLVRVPALAFLPEPLRLRYGFTWDKRRRVAWSVARRMVRRSLPFAPAALRYNKHARRTAKP